MKTIRLKNPILAALVATVLAVSGYVVQAANDIYFGPTGSEASVSNPDGTWINMWGPAWVSTTFDAANPPPGGDTQGSVYIQNNWSGSDGDSYNMISPGTWWGNIVFSGTDYTNLVFDFKYDTNSTINPASQAHIEWAFDGGYAEKKITTFTSTNIDPATLTPYFDGNWHHVQIPIPSSMSGVSSVDGVSFYQWNPGPTAGTMNFWMANVMLFARITPVAPPTINTPVKTAPAGLAVYASTQGNSFYDRQSALFITNSGTSWMSSGGTYPVSYSFTIADFPTDPATYGCEAWLFLSPNPAAIDNAPDWNETNMVISFIQLNTNGATMHFQYKVNEDHQQAMYSGGSETRTTATTTNTFYYSAAPGSLPGGPITNVVSPGVYDITNESGDLGTVVSPAGANGTWTITFTSANTVTLSAPGGNSTNLTIPSYNAPYLAPGANGMYIYLGMQANNAASLNQRIVYSNFAITGGAPTVFIDNFAADSTLNTNAWAIAQATGKAIFIVKPGWFFSWNLPDAGFSPQVGTDLTNPTNWAEPVNTKPFALLNEDAQIVSGSDIPAGNTVFYRLIKRTYTQLQVLLPGETNAPGTPTGKVGTPLPVTSATDVPFTINACDSTWHIVNQSSHYIHLTSTTDSQFVGQSDTALVNGTVQMIGDFFTTGPQTVTVTDTIDTNIPPATSSTVTVN